jgi:hypothetical protein
VSISPFDRSVSGVFEVIAAFVGLDSCDETADMATYVVDVALLGGAHPVLDLGEGLLDRIEVGRVWRQIPESCAGLDQAAQGSRPVAAEIDGADAPSRHRCAKVVSLTIT